MKLHLLLNHEGYLPVFADITAGKTHEVTVGRAWSFPKGSIVVFDKGYWDFFFFDRLCREGVFFVTRMKVNALYEVLERRKVPERGNILSDEIIRLSSAKGQALCPQRLRRVTVWIPEKQETLVLITNHLGFGATTVAAIYKERWQIELFFKALKGNLRIKSFVGTSKNALYTQIWTALIAILMLKIMALRSKLGWSLSTLAAMLRWNLFTHRDLWDWVDNPCGPPPDEATWEYPSLFDSAFGQHLVFPKGGTSS